MTAQLAHALRSIADAGGDKGYVSVAAYGHSAIHGRLKHWNLIETPSPRSGRWRLTPAGKTWLEGKVRIPEQIQVLNNQRVDSGSGSMISFSDALALSKPQSEWESEVELEWLRDRAREERAYLEED